MSRDLRRRQDVEVFLAASEEVVADAMRSAARAVASEETHAVAGVHAQTQQDSAPAAQAAMFLEAEVSQGFFYYVLKCKTNLAAV